MYIICQHWCHACMYLHMTTCTGCHCVGAHSNANTAFAIAIAMHFPVVGSALHNIFPVIGGTLHKTTSCMPCTYACSQEPWNQQKVPPTPCQAPEEPRIGQCNMHRTNQLPTLVSGWRCHLWLDCWYCAVQLNNAVTYGIENLIWTSTLDHTFADQLLHVMISLLWDSATSIN